MEEEIGAIAMKHQCALSKNILSWLKKGNFFTFFLKTEGLVSSKLLKKQSTVVSWLLDLLSRCDFLCLQNLLRSG